MKGLLTFITIIGLGQLAYAQADAQQKGDTTTQAPYENKVDNLYRQQDDMVAVQTEEIPQGLSSTLKQSRYQGWEQGTLMRSPDGKVYELRMNKGKKVKVFRFDEQGQAIKD